jgi:[acyl-carrier-protein] S-malonyltransferase
MAGHSLGEYTALVAAGTLDFADALRVVRVRGRLMQAAVPVGAGAMAAIVGVDDDAIEGLCTAAREHGEVLGPANVNGAGQVVLAGHAAAVERALALAKERGAKLARRLAVSAPFHCELMGSAAAQLAPILANTPMRTPRVPVLSNVDGVAMPDPAAVRERLCRQVERTVRWDRCVRTLADLGCAEALEIGPGNVLSGLVRRMGVGIRSRPVGTAVAVEQMAAGSGA